MYEKTLSDGTVEVHTTTKEFAELYRTMSATKLAKHYGISVVTIRDWCKRLGLKKQGALPDHQIRLVSAKQYYEAVRYTKENKTDGFWQLWTDNVNTHIDNSGKLQIYYTHYSHIGVPEGYWVIKNRYDNSYKVYSDADYHKKFLEERWK